MTALLLTWIANSVAILLVAYLMHSVSLASWKDAFAAGAVLSLVNMIVRPVLVILTLPITILSLGLFYFCITAICLWITELFLPGFAVHGALSTLIASVLISLASAIIHRALVRAAR